MASTRLSSVIRAAVSRRRHRILFHFEICLAQVLDYEIVRNLMYRNAVWNSWHCCVSKSVVEEELLFVSNKKLMLLVNVMAWMGGDLGIPAFPEEDCILQELIPQDYLSFVVGSVDELGDFTAELKMSLFQFGISPQIIASIILQVLCYAVPSLVKLWKEGLDGQEKIKSYVWWMSLGFAIVEAVMLGQACDADKYVIGLCNMVLLIFPRKFLYLPS
ncbi:putative SecY/SEC61-alpha family protein [Rosa chinensis]|uniref:Putative SecY/SEC61-alpha family protein n=1 Tax=Rosa chinensis TaxID=74649 RepID=A0A2P6QK80_ROSCH|nr:putative SecY/SEC61-alpha family protein [Rosa chinensis]